MAKKNQKLMDSSSSSGNRNSYLTKAFPARVEEISGPTGARGEAVQVRCKILEGKDANKIIRRNVKRPVAIGDILMLRETEIEARPLNQKRRGGI